MNKREELRALLAKNPNYTNKELAARLRQSVDSVRAARSKIGQNVNYVSPRARLYERIRDMVLANPDMPNRQIAKRIGCEIRMVWYARDMYKLPVRKTEEPKCTFQKARPLPMNIASACLPTRQTGYLKLL